MTTHARSHRALRYAVPAVVLVLFLLVPAFVRGEYYLHVLVGVMFFAYMASAWNIVCGYTGQLSLGHSALCGIGGYVSTLLFINLGLSPWVGMFLGAFCAMAVGVFVGYPCFRLRGPYFALTTIAFAEILRIWVENKEYDKAFSQINKLRQIYPNKPFLLWFLGQAQLENDMYSGAIQTYKNLLEALTSSPYYGPAGEVECRYDLALAYYLNKDLANSSAQIDTILTFKKHSRTGRPPEENKNIKDFVHKAEGLRKKIKKETKTG